MMAPTPPRPLRVSIGDSGNFVIPAKPDYGLILRGCNKEVSQVLRVPDMGTRKGSFWNTQDNRR